MVFDKLDQRMFRTRIAFASRTAQFFIFNRWTFDHLSRSTLNQFSGIQLLDSLTMSSSAFTIKNIQPHHVTAWTYDIDVSKIFNAISERALGPWPSDDLHGPLTLPVMSRSTQSSRCEIAKNETLADYLGNRCRCSRRRSTN